MERDLHLTANNAAIVERAAEEIAREYGLQIENVHGRILSLLAPHPPRAQCKGAIDKVREECIRTLRNPPGTER